MPGGLAVWLAVLVLETDMRSCYLARCRALHRRRATLIRPLPREGIEQLQFDGDEARNPGAWRHHDPSRQGWRRTEAAAERAAHRSAAPRRCAGAIGRFPIARSRPRRPRVTASPRR